MQILTLFWRSYNPHPKAISSTQKTQIESLQNSINGMMVLEKWTTSILGQTCLQNN
jgi:hypothetical protein